MDSARHRPSASFHNPFDSSDDEHEDRKFPSSRGTYVNPFDDDHAADDRAKFSPLQRRKLPRVKNPVEEEEDDEEESEPALRKECVMKRGSLKEKLDKGTLFDEEPVFHGGSNCVNCITTNSSDSTSAFERARGLRYVNASKSFEVAETRIHHIQSLKESSFNAFKSSEGKAKPSLQRRNVEHIDNVHPHGLRKDAYAAAEIHDSNIAAENARSLLFTEETQPYAHNARNLYDFTPLEASSVRYDDEQFQGAYLEQRSIEELENYAVQKSGDTTKCLQNCVKVTEEIKEDVSRTLISLHQQGQQLRRTHEVTYDIDQNLSVGEKLLGSLGGIFTRTWKPKRGPAINGPRSDPKEFQVRRKDYHLDRQNSSRPDSKASLVPAKQPFFDVSHSPVEATEVKLKIERAKQDDVLSDLSNVLDELKEMSIDMGIEISRQNRSLDNFQNDVVVLDDRIKRANMRGRRLLGK
ncbi:hypothetical protein KP509_07G071900 [Ceratopteris richardii]|uniref:t-SNARE coiled-coil homology domain-containing protein n=1 Tax=Ceratopteris richardii TaxID=49495 RepID=A0A8T2UI45_CERRI|nr:hypothetical protein KP509_07G071900 [Ceratopteris richardii]